MPVFLFINEMNGREHQGRVEKPGKEVAAAIEKSGCEKGSQRQAGNRARNIQQAPSTNCSQSGLRRSQKFLLHGFILIQDHAFLLYFRFAIFVSFHLPCTLLAKILYSLNSLLVSLAATFLYLCFE